MRIQKTGYVVDTSALNKLLLVSVMRFSMFRVAASIQVRCSSTCPSPRHRVCHGSASPTRAPQAPSIAPASSESSTPISGVGSRSATRRATPRASPTITLSLGLTSKNKKFEAFFAKEPRILKSFQSQPSSSFPWIFLCAIQPPKRAFWRSNGSRTQCFCEPLTQWKSWIEHRT